MSNPVSGITIVPLELNLGVFDWPNEYGQFQIGWQTGGDAESQSGVVMYVDGIRLMTRDYGERFA